MSAGIARGSTLQKNCEACFALITVRVADHKRGWGRFCDKACASAHKCGQRPRDVNAGHAKWSIWAEQALARRVAAGFDVWPTAPRIKDQLGRRVKVQPIYHSPSLCRGCGEKINGPGLCLMCDCDDEGDAYIEAGWDGHKAAEGEA